jgi:hypothetical protein
VFVVRAAGVLVMTLVAVKFAEPMTFNTDPAAIGTA